VNTHLYEARGPHRLDSKTTLPPAPRRVVVDVHRTSGWFTDPDHLDALAHQLHAVAEWLRTPAAVEPDPQLTIDDFAEEAGNG
jgi:hypothetical protein